MVYCFRRKLRFSILINYYLQVSFNVKVVLDVVKITQNAVTKSIKNLGFNQTTLIENLSVITYLPLQIRFPCSCAISLHYY